MISKRIKRYVLPKGSSFDDLTQEKVNILMSNINSTSRDTLNGKINNNNGTKTINIITNGEMII